MDKVHMISISGSCPSCGKKITSIGSDFAHRIFYFFHEQDNFSRFSNRELAEIRLCSANQITRELTQRNYLLEEEN